MAIESRLYRHFVEVARTQSFARAAERIGVASPALSRSIQHLEAELGVALLTRTTRSVTLTSAGSALLDQVAPALEALDAAELRVRRSAASQRSLLLAVKADADGGLLQKILDAVENEPDAAPVAVRLCGWGEHADLVRRGEVDAAIAYEPFELSGLDAELIFAEPRVAALHYRHALAGRSGLSVAELGVDPASIDSLTEDDIRRTKTNDLAQFLALVALGTAETIVPQSVAARYPRPGVVYVPLLDAPPARLFVIWHELARGLAVAALVRAATTAATTNTPIRNQVSNGARQAQWTRDFANGLDREEPT